jgi:hypothetical protein
MATDRSTNDDLDLETADLGSPDAVPGTTWVPEDAEDSPRDAPLLADDYGLTSAEEARDEPLGQRLHREVPDVPLGHVAVDPAMLAETGFAGRLVRDDDGVDRAGGDTGGFSAEEAAVHLQRPRATRPRAATRSDRLDLVEAEVAVLLAMGRIHTEVLVELTDALQRTPDEEPGEAAVKVSRGARRAHALLLALRDVPR